MNILTNLYRSSLGKKYVMAITGLLLFAFVVVHMLGNLQVFIGPKALNDYAEFLKSKPGLLWTARLGLFVIALLHIISAVLLVKENRAARPIGYEEKKPSGASFASRTIFISGLIVLVFIVYHLLHFTVGVINPALLQLKEPVHAAINSGAAATDPILERHDVYRMVIQGFSNIWVSAFYIVSMALLCLHLSHGLTSMFQSVGLRNKAWEPVIKRFAQISALIIFIGNSIIPLAVLTGLVK